jgi:xeroderma pigmentosum group C-complementing protein
MNGIVVAQEYREAVMAVMATLLDEKNQAEEHKKSIEALKRWRRFLMGVRIRERLGIYQDVEQVNKVDMGVNDRAGDEGKGGENVDTGGGFFAEPGDQASGSGFFAEPEVRTSGGGFFTEAEDHSFGPGGAPIASTKDSSGGFIVDNNDHGGGGFMVDDKDHGGGGGFIVDDNDGDEGGGGFIVEDNGEDQGGGSVREEEEGSEEGELFEDPEDEDLGWF